MVASWAPTNRTALLTSVSSTGWMSAGELLIARRMSAVAVCCSCASTSSRLLVWSCSSASLRAFCRSAYDAGEPLPGPCLTGAPQPRQNWACDGLSCWHRGHFIAHSPRAGRGSGLATIAWGRGAGQQHDRGLRVLSPELRHLRLRLLQPVRHPHLAVHRLRGGEMLLRLLAWPVRRRSSTVRAAQPDRERIKTTTVGAVARGPARAACDPPPRTAEEPCQHAGSRPGCRGGTAAASSADSLQTPRRSCRPTGPLPSLR